MLKKAKKLNSPEIFWAVLTALMLLVGRHIHLPFTLPVLSTDCVLWHLGMPLLTLWFLWRRFRLRRTDFPLTRMALLLGGMMGFWLVYGSAAVFISPYTDLRGGFSVLENLLLGMCGAYCVYESCSTRRAADAFFTTIRLVCGILLLLGLAESLTGLHLPHSRLTIQPEMQLKAPDGLSFCTVFWYDPNDFCSLTAMLLPTLFPSREVSWLRNVLRCAAIVLAFFLYTVDDASTSILAALAGILLWAVLDRRNRALGLGVALGSLGLQFGATQLLIRRAALLKKALLRRPARVPLRGTGYNSTVSHILGGITGDALGDRLLICRDDLRIALGTWGLGCGPGGNARYLALHGANTGYTSPHCWWLEILSQHGLPVFAAYVAALALLYVRLAQAWLRTREPKLVLLLAMGAAFVLASMAPSDYYLVSQQWILPGLGAALLRLYGAPAQQDA